MVITNNINVVNILQGYAGIEVIVAGGMVRHADGGIVGEAAVDFIRQFKVDYAIIGTSAIDEDGTLLDYDYREVKVSRKIVESSRRVDPGRRQLEVRAVRAGAHRPHLEINHFVTDAPPPPALRRICEEHGVVLDVATDDGHEARASA